MIQQNSKFESLNFDTHPSQGKFDTISVQVDLEQIVKGYACAYTHELHRRNPLKFDASGLTEERLSDYFSYLVIKRLECIHDVCRDFRLIRSLYVPDWIAFVLDKLGIAYYMTMGLIITPSLINLSEFKFQTSETLGKPFGYEEAQAISDILRSFKPDGVGMTDNVFPRSKDGDPDVMSTLLINDYMHSMKEIEPYKTYVSAFLGLKLLGDVSWEVLFRVRYDDINYLYSKIVHEEALI